MTTKRTVHVIDHPFVGHLLTQMRDRTTPSIRFKQLMCKVGQLLAYEVARGLHYRPHRVETPLEPYEGTKLALPLTLVPILRAGLGLADGMLETLPEAHVGHIGMFRNEEDLRPVSYYEKFPLDIAGGTVILVDPMLATGGTVMAAVQLLKNHRCTDIRFVCALAAPEGIKKLHAVHPDVPIYAGALDRQLDHRGYILPGLGDAGDRIFGTTE
jgi:uracil phosphoribosyltransferase